MKFIIAILFSLLLFSCSGEQTDGERNEKSSAEGVKEHKSIHQLEWEKYGNNENEISADADYIIKVEETVAVNNTEEVRLVNPRFTSDGKILILSSENYNELWQYNLADRSLEKIIEMPVCGNGFKLLSNPGRIVFRTKEQRENKKWGPIYSIMSYTFTNKKVELLHKSEKRLSIPTVIAGNIYFLEDEHAKCFSPIIKQFSDVFPDPFIFAQNDLLIRTLPKRDTLKFRETNLKFVKAEYSNDGKFVFAITANNGTLILNRTNQQFSQNKNASNISKLSSSNLISFTSEIDDGQRTTKSEIYLGFIDNDKSVKFPNAEGELRFNPDWSPVENKIAYNTSSGEVKILSFNLEIDSK